MNIENHSSLGQEQPLGLHVGVNQCTVCVLAYAYVAQVAYMYMYMK